MPETYSLAYMEAIDGFYKARQRLQVRVQEILLAAGLPPLGSDAPGWYTHFSVGRGVVVAYRRLAALPGEPEPPPVTPVELGPHADALRAAGLVVKEVLPAGKPPRLLVFTQEEEA